MKIFFLLIHKVMPIRVGRTYIYVYICPRILYLLDQSPLHDLNFKKSFKTQGSLRWKYWLQPHWKSLNDVTASYHLFDSAENIARESADYATKLHPFVALPLNWFPPNVLHCVKRKIPCCDIIWNHYTIFRLSLWDTWKTSEGKVSFDKNRVTE